MVSFESCYGEYSDKVNGYLFKRLRNTHDMEDVSQETWLDVHLNLKRGFQPHNVRKWIFCVAGRNYIDFVRWGPKASFYFDHDIKQEECNQKDREERIKSLQESLGKLRESHREVINLKYSKELSVEDIASRLDVSESNVKVMLHRGRNKLKSLMKVI